MLNQRKSSGLLLVAWVLFSLDANAQTVQGLTFDLPEGEYRTPISVDIQDSRSSTTIHYTLDGTEPTTGSPVYYSPINISGPERTITIRAISSVSGKLDPTIVTRSYHVVTPFRWDLVQSPPSGDFVKVLLDATGSRLLAITRKGEHSGRLWESRDNGKTWSMIPDLPDAPWIDLGLSFDGKKIAVLDTLGNVEVSSNGVWIESQSHAGSLFGGQSLAMSGDGTTMVVAGLKLMLTEDGGISWSDRSPVQYSLPGMQPSVSNISNIGELAISRDGNDIYTAPASGGLFVTHDRGKTWLLKDKDSAHIWSGLACDSSGKKVFAVDAKGEVSRSEDGGRSWKSSGVDGIKSWRAIACSENASHILATANEAVSIWASYDSGKTWVPQTAMGSRPDIANDWPNVAVSGDGRTFATITSLAGVVNGTSAFVGVFENAGLEYSLPVRRDRSWKFLHLSDDGADIASIVDDRQVAVSNDFGNTFRLYQLPWNDPNVGIPTYCSATDGKVSTLVVAKSQSIWMSHDWGENWVKLTPIANDYVSQIAVSSDGTYLLAIGNRTYVSINSGKTWAAQSLGEGTNSGFLVLAKASADGKVMGVVQQSSTTPSKVWISSDFGKSWKLANSQLTIDWTSLAISGNGSRIVAIGFSGNYQNDVWISDDWGLTWVERGAGIGGPAFSSSMSQNGKLLVVANRNGVFLSNNSGETWSLAYLWNVWGLRTMTLSSNGSRVAVASQLGAPWIGFLDNPEVSQK